MNFELKTLDLAGAAGEKCDGLIVLFSATFKPGKDILSAQLAAALKADDLESKAGKSLVLYRPSGVTGTRVVMACVGEGSAKEVRQSVTAAVATLKSAQLKKC